MFIIIPFFEPNGLTYYYLIDRFFFCWRILSICLGLLIISRNPESIREVSKDLFILLVVAFFLEICYSGVVNKSLSVNTIWQMFNILFVMVFYLYLIRNKEYDIIEFSSGILIIISLINLLCVLFDYRLNIIDDVYFIGIKTSFTPYMIFSVSLTFVDSIIRRGRLLSAKVVFSFAIAYYQLIYKWVAAGVLLLAFFLIAVILLRHLMRYWKHMCLIACVTAICLNYLTVFMNIQTRLSFLIEGLLKKTLTLHDRTFIWKNVLLSVARSPILGYGGLYVKTSWYLRNMLAHNQWLQVLLAGGIIGAIVLTLVIVYMSCSVDNSNNDYIRLICTVSLSTMLLLFIVEVVYVSYAFWIFLTIIYSTSKYFDFQKNNGIELYE